MPVRTASWNNDFRLAPIFEMNLPEGALREHLRLRFAKAVGTFDDFDLLGIIGRTQIGRIRYSAADATLNEDVPFQSIDEILRARRGNKLFDQLIERFAVHSGLSGVQPKVMIRGREPNTEPTERYLVQGATHIVKFWHADQFPDLAANEFFCLSVAKKAELAVPAFELSADGSALVVERFDYLGGDYLGFEDFCVLNGLRTDEKYAGGYETRIFRRLKEYVSPEKWSSEADKLYRLFVLNCAIRNGDAHLKNFGVVYSDVDAEVGLAPVYDLVTTTPYIPNDTMALTIRGSTNWPARRSLEELGQARADLSLQRIKEICEQTADAMADVAPAMRKYFKKSEFGVGSRMEEAWLSGIRETLGFAERTLVPIAKPKTQPRLASSDTTVLEYLREHGGKISGSQRQMAKAVGLAESTFKGALQRLSQKKMIVKTRGEVALARVEV
jgi:serine/threonine-protein kinase HipA